MARLPRLTLAGLPHHIIQRGNNRQVIFLDLQDRQQMLSLLGENAERFRVAMHAYVLMDNHVHLLATPGDSEGLSHFMQSIGRRYVRYFNDRHGRSGTLWEGRYKSTIVQTDRYLLACMAYIDLNPVRAGIVPNALDFLWSSHAHYVGARVDRLITPHGLYWDLGNTPFAREAAYADLVRAGLAGDQKQEIDRATNSGWLLGDEKYVAQLQMQTDRRLSQMKSGRPPSRARP